jgi:hypothetical protein
LEIDHNRAEQVLHVASIAEHEGQVGIVMNFEGVRRPKNV